MHSHLPPLWVILALTIPCYVLELWGFRRVDRKYPYRDDWVVARGYLGALLLSATPYIVICAVWVFIP